MHSHHRALTGQSQIKFLRPGHGPKSGSFAGSSLPRVHRRPARTAPRPPAGKPSRVPRAPGGRGAGRGGRSGALRGLPGRDGRCRCPRDLARRLGAHTWPGAAALAQVWLRAGEAMPGLGPRVPRHGSGGDGVARSPGRRGAPPGSRAPSPPALPYP